MILKRDTPPFFHDKMSNIKNERVHESDKLIECLSILYKLVNDDSYFLY